MFFGIRRYSMLLHRRTVGLLSFAMMGTVTPEHLRDLVYYDCALDRRFDPLPGVRLTAALEWSDLDPDDWLRTGKKIEQSIRKLLMMWTAGDYALEAEQDFYCRTLQEAPALFGKDAVLIQYHCESLIFFARSSLDLAAYAFGKLLPAPLSVERTDSFNELLKTIIKKAAQHPLATLVESWRTAKPGWLPLVAGLERGRSLRDQLAHQVGFPLRYRELEVSSEKRSAVVVLEHDEVIPLTCLIETLRVGVVNGFLAIEDVCAHHWLDG